MPRTTRMTFGLISGLIVLLVAYFLVQSFSGTSAIVEVDGSVEVRIPVGASFDAILDSLVNTGLVEDRLSFRILAKVTGAEEELKSGTYRFHPETSHIRLLEALRTGESAVRVKVTFPEGVTIRRIASIASRTAGVDSARLHALATDREFLATLGLNAETAEGYLMPDTYFLNWGAEPEVLLREMSALFLRFYTEERKQKAVALGLTPYEAVILASLVEGEARTDTDRPIVASLYLNRVRRGMKLQADPTIQYILPDGPRRLLYRDLEIDNPYNTYRYRGWPPTPINNPGRASLEAALAPAETDYLYMVAKADGSGAHTFSTNLADHQRAVDLYRRRVAADRTGTVTE